MLAFQNARGHPLPLLAVLGLGGFLGLASCGLAHCPCPISALAVVGDWSFSGGVGAPGLVEARLHVSVDRLPCAVQYVGRMEIVRSGGSMASV